MEAYKFCLNRADDGSAFINQMKTYRNCNRMLVVQNLDEVLGGGSCRTAVEDKHVVPTKRSHGAAFKVPGFRRLWREFQRFLLLYFLKL